MNKVYVKIFFCALLSVQLQAQTFIYLETVQNELDQLNRNYFIQPKTIELDSRLSNMYDSCHVHALYTINDAKLMSTEVPRVKCFCKNGSEKLFSDSGNNEKSGYPYSVDELLNQIREEIDSPIIIINDKEIPNSGDIYLGAIRVKFQN